MRFHQLSLVCLLLLRVATAVAAAPAAAVAASEPDDDTTPAAEDAAAEATFRDEIVVSPSRFDLLQEGATTPLGLDRVEIERLPHFADDVFRLIGRLPGASGGDISSRFHLRGGRENEALVRIDGLTVAEPFHLKDFQSVFSILDAKAIGSVQVSTGGFTAEYGDRMSGVLDISTASPAAPRRHAVGASFTSLRLASEGRWGGERGEWLVSARRGYLDVVLDWVDPGGRFAPVYHDLLAKGRFRPTERASLAINALASHDDVLFRSEDGDERADARYGNAYLWAVLDTAWRADLYGRTLVSVGEVRRDRTGGVDSGAVLSAVADERRFDSLGLAQDWTWQRGDHHLFKGGLQVETLGARYDYRSFARFSDPLLTGGGPPIERRRRSRLRPSGESLAAYASDRALLGERLAVEVGLRWDRQSHTHDAQTSPRLNVAYDWQNGVVLRAAWGRFAQSQRLDELQVEDGVETFFPAQWAEHQVLSLERATAHGYALRLELYRKLYHDLHATFENLFDPIEILPEAEPDRVRVDPHRAEAEGLELSVRRSGGGRWGWWATYTRSSVVDRIGGRKVRRSWDQRHAASWSLNWRGGRWNLNLAGVHHTGWPTTAVSARLATAPDGGVVVQPFLGPRNGERYPAYHRLDVRASRAVAVRRGSLSFFLEVMNLADRDNVCCTDDLSFLVQPDGSVHVERDEETWLPIVPSFGVSYEF